jgi:hypothetical protein
MARKEILELEVKTNSKEAEKDLEKVQDGVKNVEKEFVKTNKEVKKTPRLIRGVTAGTKLLGNALKAAGIGLVVALLAKFGQVLSQNQKFVDGFAKSTEFLSRVFNDFFTFIDNSIGPVQEFFKQIFENPLESIKEFGKLIRENIIERIMSAIEVFGLAGKAIKQFLERDFAGALETAKQAGKELVDVGTGINNSVDRLGATIVDASKSIKEYASETFNAAASQVELEKRAKLAEAQIRQSILANQADIEIQRQLRDNISLTIDERIKANDKVGELLIEQGKQEKALAQIQVNAAQSALSANKGNIELQLALINAKTELIDVEERILGFQSEQQINEQGLLQERKDNLKQIELIGKTEREEARITAQQLRDQQRELIERTITEDVELKQALLANEAQYTKSLQDLEDEALAKEEAAIKKQEAFKEEVRKNEIIQEALLRDSKIQMAENTLGAIGALLGDSAKAQKAVGIATALIDTYRGIAAGVALGFPAAIPAVAAAAATGFATVKKIISTKVPTVPGSTGGASSGGASSGSAVAPQAIAPSFNIVGDSGSNQIRDAINTQGDKPKRAYVVSKDISTQLELDRNTQGNASL